MPTTANHTNQAEKDGLLTVFSLIESLQNPAIIIKPDGLIQVVNSLFASRIGKTPKACIDHHIYDLLNSDFHCLPLAEALEKQCASTLLSGKSSVFEDGSHIWSVTLNPIRTDSGAVTSLFVSFQEIVQPSESIEESRSACQEKLAAAFEGTGAGVWEWSLKTGELDCSGDVGSIFGSEKKQLSLSLDRFKASIYPDDLENIFPLISEAVKTERALDIAFRVGQPDGSVRWIMMRGKPVYGSNGELDRYTGVVLDITERKQLEEELAKSRLMMAQSLKAARAGIWEKDLKNDTLYWSDSMWPLFGLDVSQEPLTFALWKKVLHPEDREKAIESAAQAISAGTEMNVEYRICHADGSVRWFMSRGMPVWSDDGSFDRYLGTVIDISERKLLEEELLESKSVNGYALKAARAGVWEWDLQTDENIWDDEMWPLHGLTRIEGLNPSFRLWADSIHPDDREVAIWAVTVAARQKRELNVEYRTIHKDGSIHWLMSRAQPRLDKTRNAVCYIGTVIDITERKTAEIKLTESKVRFNFALEVTGAGIWEWDIRTDRLFWSDQIWKLYGLEPQGKISSHRLWSIHAHPEDRDLTFQTIMSAFTRRVDFTVEYRVCHPDGSVHWLMCRGVPLQSPDALPGSYLGMIMDITERKRSEEEKSKSQKQLNLVIEQGDIGVWTIDLRDFSAQRTLQYARIFGYDSVEDEWSLEAFLEHVVPEERKTISQTIRQCCKKHLNHTFECQIRTVDKLLRWIWVFGTFNYDTSTRTYYLSGIVQDITVRKQAELLLKESEQKFRNIFEFSPVAIGIADNLAGVLFDVNASWLRLFACSKDEVIGKKPGDFGMYLKAEDLHNIRHDLREHGRVSNRQLTLNNRAGKSITVLFSAESITIAGQRNMLLMMNDITVQELQQASINQLEQAVAERTEQLQEEVERLNRFLSMISHEYRTPLAIIRGNLDFIVLKHKSGDYSLQREIDKIKQAIDRLVEVMEVSIQDSRLKESSDDLVVSNFLVEPLIASQIESFRAMWPERTIRYVGHLDGAEIFGEQGQFGLAIFNLLDNARKYSPAESPIELECRVENGEVIIAIRNEGKSIASAECSELFEKYRRGSNAANTAGAGLGLWLVKDIVEHHHGAVTLRGLKTGVEAMITLPLVKSKV
jgi:PAS domain S-box-containing protein